MRTEAGQYGGETGARDRVLELLKHRDSGKFHIRMGCANSKDSGVALRAGLVGCARTGCAVSPLTGSIPDASKPRANAPLRVERGGRGPAGRSGKTSGNEIDGTASSSDATATSSESRRCFERGRPAQHPRAPMPKAHGEGQLEGSLAGTLHGFRGLRVEVDRCATEAVERC